MNMQQRVGLYKGDVLIPTRFAVRSVVNFASFAAGHALCMKRSIASSMQRGSVGGLGGISRVRHWVGLYCV